MEEIDLRRLSDADLAAVEAGDMSKVSDAGLAILAGQSPGRTHGFGDSVLQGASFGFADEIGAKLDAARGRGTYDQGWRDRAVAREQYNRENPGRALAGEMVGAVGSSVVPALGAMNVLRGTSMAPRIGATAARYGGAAAAGGAGGAITGAGTGQPDQRGAGAVTGGVTGAVMGPAATGVGSAARIAGQAAADVTAGIPGAQRIGQAIGGVTGATLDPLKRAQEKLLQSIRRDDLTPDDLRRAMDAAVRGGAKPEVLADFGGPNMRALSDIAQKYPGTARRMADDMIGTRMEGQLERVTGDLSRAFRVQGDPAEVARTLSMQRANDARPLYAQAYQEGAQITDPATLQYLSLPAFQRAYGVARRIAQYDGVELPADPRGLTGASLQTLDYVKRGLDDVLYSGKVTGSLGRAERRAIEQARGEYVQRLDQLVPSYAQARAAWAGPTVLQEALEAGGDLSRMSLSEVQQTLQRMSAGELEQFKIGALGALRQKAAQSSDGRDLVKVLYGSPEKREILRSLVGDEFPTLEAQMLRERAIRRTDDTVRGNSATVGRDIARKDLEGDTNVMQSIVQQGPLRGGIDYVLRSGTGVAQPTADALGPMLFSNDGPAMRNLLREIAEMDKRMRQRAAAMGAGTGSAAGAGGSLLTTD